MMDILREKIIAAIRSGTWPTNDEQVEGIEEAADAILAIPELKEARAEIQLRSRIEERLAATADERPFVDGSSARRQ